MNLEFVLNQGCRVAFLPGQYRRLKSHNGSFVRTITLVDPVVPEAMYKKSRFVGDKVLFLEKHNHLVGGTKF